MTVAIEMTQTCEASPLQYEGTVNGKPFYYRGRWCKWWFGVGATFNQEGRGPLVREGSIVSTEQPFIQSQDHRNAEALRRGLCASCKVNDGAASDEQSRRLGLRFCICCMYASKDFAACGLCGAPLPFLERMGAAGRQLKAACSACTRKLVNS